MRTLCASVAVLMALAVHGMAQAQSLESLARQEGEVVWYTSVGLQTAEKIAAMFEERYGVRVQVNRTGSERVFTRVLQEAAARVYEVDVIHTSDAGHFEYLKEQGLLAQYWPAGIEVYPDLFKDPDGYWFVWRAGLVVPAYNTNLVAPEDVPRRWTDFLDPRWRGRMAKAHPGYSGNIVTSTLALVNLYGWEFFEQLATQDVLQLQSANDPAPTVAAGERALAFEGTEYIAYQLRAQGNPLELIYPEDGIPFVASPSAIAANAPHPNAARLFTDFLFSLEVQQALVEDGLTSGHPDVVYPTDQPQLSELNLLTVSPKELMERAQEVTETYIEIFGL